MMSHPSENAPLAIVGLACRLPGADNLNEFWRLLRSGGSGIVELPSDRLDRELYYHPAKGQRNKSYSALGGLVSARPFDRAACPLPDELIAGADIAHLTLCEVAAAACRDARLDPFDLPLRNAGVYVGHTAASPLASQVAYAASAAEMAQYVGQVEPIRSLPPAERNELIQEIVAAIRRDRPRVTDAASINLSSHAAAGLIAHGFGLSGPFLVVDAACASSLQALMIGAAALRQGRIDMALVGGASYCKSDTLVLFSQAQSLSAKGSRPFDADADGLILAEGYVVMVVKTVARALADGDQIQAVIRGIGMATDGRGKSLWAPRKEGQVLAIRRAYEPDIDARSLQYIEAHATSTQIGDATELQALAEALNGRLPPGKKIPIGSVKANVGHTLEAAGLSGLAKTVLAMRNALIPPAVNCKRLNPEIDWQRAPFFVPTAELAWPAGEHGGPRRAGVNSFGIGGLNVHVVLDEFPEPVATGGAARVAGVRSVSLKNTETQAVEPEAVAVVGAGCILPGARTLAAFWELLISGRDAKVPLPSGRWNPASLVNSQTGKTFADGSLLGGFITDYAYDWKRHIVPPKQVEQANPLQFMLLDATEEALADAGYDQKPLDRSRVGVVVGTIFGDEFAQQLNMGLRLPQFQRTLGEVLRGRGVQPQAIAEASRRFADILIERMPALIDETGSFTSSTLASRITKAFDLLGGALALDAGPASGLAVVAAGVDFLLNRSCDAVVCAAGERNMGLLAYEAYAVQGRLAGGPARSPFDAQAAGTVPGEGVGVVLLKRLSDARRDGDRIRAVIRGLGAASGGDIHQTARLAMRRALRDSHIAPERVAALEITSSALPGEDAQHAAAIAETFGSPNRTAPLAVGSLTGQIGDTSAASGMAGLIKTVLSLDHARLPGNVGLQNVAPWLADKTRDLRASSQASELSAANADGRLFAGVTASAGGSLAYHVLLERGAGVKASESSALPARQTAAARAIGEKWRIVRIGAATLGELVAKSQAAAGACQALFAAGSTAGFKTEDSWRLALVVDGVDSLAVKLSLAAGQLANPAGRPALEEQGIFCREASRQRPRVAMLFPGQGSQYAGMLGELIREFPPAASARQEVDAAMALFGLPDFAELTADAGGQLGVDVLRTQLAMLLADVIMFRALSAIGVEPSLVSAHSYGEFPALVASGAWSLEQAVGATVARCKAIDGSWSGPPCEMLSTTAPPEVVRHKLGALSDVFLSHHNAPNQTVVAGRAAGVRQLAEQLRGEGFDTRPLSVPRPFHTPLMASAQEPFRRALASAWIVPPRVPLVSSVNGQLASDAELIRVNLVNQLTAPVDFVGLIKQIAEQGPTVFIEVGPQQVLTRLSRRILEGSATAISIASDNSKRPGLEQLCRVRALLECTGAADETQHPPAAAVRAVEDRRHQPLASQFVNFDATQRRKGKLRTANANVQLAGTESDRGSTEVSDRSEPIGPTLGGGGVLAANGHAVDSRQPASSKNGPPPGELEAFLINFVVEQTGYPPEIVRLDADLEADLGIDSIKKAQLFGELREYFDVTPTEGLRLDDFPTLRHVVNFLHAVPGKGDWLAPAESAAAPAAVPAAAMATTAALVTGDDSLTAAFGQFAPLGARVPDYPTNGSVPSMLALSPSGIDATAPVGAHRAPVTIRARANAPPREELQKFLINFVVEQTGYPTEIVRMDADLEADLGIDSIKKAQLFGELGEFFDVSAPENLRLDDFPTLRHVLALLQTSSVDGDETGPVVAGGLAAEPADSLATATSAETAVVARAPAAPSETLQSAAIDIITIRGTSYETARQYGQQHGPQIRAMLKQFADRGKGSSADAARLVGIISNLGETYSTDQLAEMQGVADGARVHVGNIIAHNLASGANGARHLAHESITEHRNGSAVSGAAGNGAVTQAIAPSGSLEKSSPPQKARITERLVLRMMNSPLPTNVSEAGFQLCGAVLILGDNRLARALERRLVSRGADVLVVPADSWEQVREEFGRLWARRPIAHLFLTTSHDAAAGAWRDEQAWANRRDRGLILPFLLCQEWVTRINEAKLAAGATLVAATSLGGDFGLAGDVGAIEGGGVTGLVKSLFIESLYESFKGIHCHVLDFAADEHPDASAAMIYRELALGEPNLEVGFVGGNRRVMRAVPHEVGGPIGCALPRGTWVVTGGARGVTAVAALALGRRYGLKLHLIGMSSVPQIDPSWRTLSPEGIAQLKTSIMRQADSKGLAPHEEWTKVDKALQIDRTLRACAAAGVSATYHACDVSDWRQLDQVLVQIRAADGPIEGVLHGAAIIRDAMFERKKLANVRLTLGAKVDAAAALMELTRNDPLRHFIGFSSVSGRFGIRGQSDYSAANESLCKQIDWFRRERPECQSVGVHWHAWDEIGVAARPELQATFASMEVKFMPPAEGIEHLVREIEAGLTEGEVLFTDAEYLRQQYPIPAIASADEIAVAEAIHPPKSEPAAPTDRDLASGMPLVASVSRHDPDRHFTASVRLDPVNDPFLAEHRLAGRPLLPFVIAMEGLAEAGRGLSGTQVAGFRNLEIHSGLSFKSDLPQTVEIAAEWQGDGPCRCRLTSEFRDREGRLVDAQRLQVTADVELAAEKVRLQVDGFGQPPLGWFPLSYPDDAIMYHGPHLRCLKQVACQYDGGFGQIVAPAIEELGGSRTSRGWIVPAAVLDACLYACGTFAYLMFAKRVEIPAGMDRLRLGRQPRATEVCVVRMLFRGHDARGSRYDFNLFGDDGECLLAVEGYRTTAISPGVK